MFGVTTRLRAKIDYTKQEEQQVYNLEKDSIEKNNPDIYINLTDENHIVCDSKVSLDMNAIYRHENFKDFENEIPIPVSEQFAKAKNPRRKKRQLLPKKKL